MIHARIEAKYKEVDDLHSKKERKEQEAEAQRTQVASQKLVESSKKALTDAQAELVTVVNKLEYQTSRSR